MSQDYAYGQLLKHAPSRSWDSWVVSVPVVDGNPLVMNGKKDTSAKNRIEEVASFLVVGGHLYHSRNGKSSPKKEFLGGISCGRLDGYLGEHAG